MRNTHLSLLILTASVLVGCQQMPYQKEGPLLYEAVKKGDQIILSKALTIPVERARTYLQSGREVGERQVDRFEPNCEFEVRTLSNSPVQIAPDTFTVSKVINYEEGSEGFFSSFQLGIGSSATIKYQTTIRMNSVKQPDVLQLTCSWEEIVSRGHYLSVTQFQQAIGPYLSIKALP